MVDFNSDAAVSTPAPNLRRFLIIERRHNVLEAMESYDKQAAAQGTHTNIPTGVVQARLKGLFREVHAILKHDLDEKDYLELDILSSSEDYKELCRAFYIIDDYLDKKQITKVDTRKSYDKTDLSAEDEAYGFS